MLAKFSEGTRDLFERLAACRQWDWGVCRTVLVLDLSTVNTTLPGAVDSDVGEQLARMEWTNGIERLCDSARGRLR